MRKKWIWQILFAFAFANFLITPSLAQDINEYDASQSEEMTLLNDSDALLPATTVADLYSTHFFTLPNGETVEAWTFSTDLNNLQKDLEHSEIESNYPNAIFLSEATNRYNCHSYAWYSQDYATNMYWINDPSAYLVGNYYVEVNSPMSGDIICYYNGTTAVHSGIVVTSHYGNTNGVCGNSNLMTVQSKWADGGLYEHRGDQCPYTTAAYGYSNMTDEDKATTIGTSVKYYRRSNHTHTFTYDSCNIDGRHQKTCNGCSVVIWEEHVASSYISDGDIHKAYCACEMYLRDYNHSYVAVDVGDSTQHKMQCVCGDFYFENHLCDYIEAGAATHTKMCVYCHAEITEDHYFDSETAVNSGTTHILTCDCGETSTATHSYTNHSSVSETQHRSYCICGDYVTQSHSFYYSDIGTTTHTQTCGACGFYVTTEHYVYNWNNYDDDGHSGNCRCGTAWTEDHSFWDYDDETHGGECNICDYLADYVSHTYTYVDEGDGTHTGLCMYCDHTVSGSHTTECIDLNANNHAFSCTSCSYYTTSAHIWLTRTNAQGEKYYYCSVCGRISYFLQLNSQTLVILSADEQRALTAAVKGADGDFVLYLDAETGILYLDGELYIFIVPADTVVSSYLEPVAVDDATLSLLPPLPDTETE